MKPTMELNEANFDQELRQSDVPVLVDFWAAWCGPCRMLTPVLDEIAQGLRGQAVVGKVNVDEQPALAARFNIQSIPTLLYFVNGEVRDQTMGLVSKRAIVAKLGALRPAERPA